MLQKRHIMKGVDNTIDIEDPAYLKFAIRRFHSISWMLILSNIVTINRTISQQSSCIVTTHLRSST